MKRRELTRKLRQLGWSVVRQSKHEIWGHPDRAHTIPVPRHQEINERTAQAILAAAGG